MPLQIKELAFIFHPVSDLAAARKFYEQVLGLKIGMNVEFGPGQAWIEYDIAGQALAICNAMPGAPGTSLFLEVADLDAARQSLTAAGIAVGDVQEFPPCRMFTVKDPSGNQIGLHQRKAR